MKSQTIKIDREDDKVIIDAVIAWAHTEDPQTKRIIAVCPSLNITLEVDTQAELLGEINKSMNVFFDSSMKHGDLESFLKTRGWLPPSAVVPLKAQITPRKVVVEHAKLNDLALAAGC